MILPFLQNQLGREIGLSHLHLNRKESFLQKAKRNSNLKYNTL
jgi:hypothetical protein